MIIVIMPAFNEQDSIPTLFPKLTTVLGELNEEYKIIVCNDGSSDRTQELLDEYSRSVPLEIICHKINRGLGETMRDLVERAAEVSCKNDVIVRLDCDDTHEPSYIPSIVAKVRCGYDVVIASRFEPGGNQIGVGLYRGFISRSANLFMKVFFPISGLKEYSCGYRGYRAGIIQEAVKFYGNNFIQLNGLGFTCTLEKLVKLKLIGAKFGEIPFTLRYDQKLSESKMVSSVTTLGYIVMTLLYHWPWGGWRSRFPKTYHEWRTLNSSNYNKIS